MVVEEESVSMVTVRGPDVLPIDWSADTIRRHWSGPFRAQRSPSHSPQAPDRSSVRPSPGSLRFAREPSVFHQGPDVSRTTG